MISVSVDEAALMEIYREEVQKKLDKANKDLVLWDTSELKRRVCMSWNTIQENFFYDPRFPKHKIGCKWYYPAKEAEAFLLIWFEEQRLAGKKRRSLA
ncbi:group-specific protein [Domibacillus mangrovi]|uniref:Group-specific protein n=1 Tax=Domibacillus mangrovi TaxID=1714354 RepID=A0A1Q5P447_9BACI|nr:group-specific protein [Domibacillus mangrovi]OKL37024.1 group-specific protein [Domibacillus mangrovi]